MYPKKDMYPKMARYINVLFQVQSFLGYKEVFFEGYGGPFSEINIALTLTLTLTLTSKFHLYVCDEGVMCLILRKVPWEGTTAVEINFR